MNRDKINEEMQLAWQEYCADTAGEAKTEQVAEAFREGYFKGVLAGVKLLHQEAVEIYG